MISTIPPLLRNLIEKKTGGTIATEKPRGGGGASREGVEVTLELAGGEHKRCYLSWDNRAGDPSRTPYFERETAVLRALSGPFADSGVRVARLLAAEPRFLAHLTEFVEGENRFPHAGDKGGIAMDFIRQLAGLHALDSHHPAFAALGDPGESTAARIRANLHDWRAQHLLHRPEPIFQLALDWLLANVPKDDGAAVIVHGDAGPGNFLFDEHNVTALLDWEFVHFGDPVEDLGQIAVRSLIQPFIPMAQVVAAYEKASGRSVELSRLRYHRLYFQISFLVPGHVAQQSASAAARGTTGQAMLFSTMHRRVVVESLAELMHIDLHEPPLPECQPTPHDRGFELALADLRHEIVPNLASQRAAAKAKDLARLIKYWRMRDRCGARFDAAEIAELQAALGAAATTIADGRVALARAVAAGDIRAARALQLCHNRMRRETCLMAGAMGALATTTYDRMGASQ